MSTASAVQTRERTRRKIAMTVGIVVALLAAGTGLWYGVLRDTTPDAVAAPKQPVEVDSAPIDATGTTDIWTTTIATANVPEITVYATPPAEVSLDSDELERRRSADASYAIYGAPYSTNGEIPALNAAVVGRLRTEAGWVFSNPTENDQPRVFRVTEDHGDWLKVQIPARPNNTEGWVKAAEVTLSTTDYHIRVDLSDRTLTLLKGEEVVLTQLVGIGKDVTPTPTGRIYLTDIVEKYEGSAYGKWILQLSGFSTALDDFAGGAPVLAIHGTRNPDNAGKQVSNGCIRVPGDAISTLASTVPLGTPVDIVD